MNENSNDVLSVRRTAAWYKNDQERFVRELGGRRAVTDRPLYAVGHDGRSQEIRVSWPGIELSHPFPTDTLDAAIAGCLAGGQRVCIHGAKEVKSVRFPPDFDIGVGKLHGQLVLILPSVPRAVGRARRFGQLIAEDIPLEDQPGYDYLVALGEALTNAVKHGSPKGAKDSFGVRFALHADALVTQVRDHGAWCTRLFEEETLAPGGYGMRIIEELVDQVWMQPVSDGTIVSFLVRV